MGKIVEFEEVDCLPQKSKPKISGDFLKKKLIGAPLPIGQYILGCLLDAERFHDFMFDEKSAH